MSDVKLLTVEEVDNECRECGRRARATIVAACECDDAQILAGEAWAAGVKLASEIVERKSRIQDLGSELFKCASMVRKKTFERDMARFEIVWLQKWVAKNDCENPRWPPASSTSESSDCGECVPCKARTALGEKS